MGSSLVPYESIARFTLSREWRSESRGEARDKYVVSSLVIRLAIRGARLGIQIDSRVPASGEARTANPVFTHSLSSAHL